jgi:hypothetical protein
MIHADFIVGRLMRCSDHTVTLKGHCSRRQNSVQNLPNYADCGVEITCRSVGLLKGSVFVLYI